MTLILVSLVLQLVCVGCFAMIVAHAFRRSLGTGFMVLCLPIYNFVYGFKQFDHRYKGLVLSGWLGGILLIISLRALGLRWAAN